MFRQLLVGHVISMIIKYPCDHWENYAYQRIAEEKDKGKIRQGFSKTWFNITGEKGNTSLYT